MYDAVVYAAIFGGYDELKPARYRDVPHVCFTDEVQGAEGWDEIVVDTPFIDHKYNSAMYFALAHQWFPDVEYSIYHGGHNRLTAHPDELIDILGVADVATFKHPCRDCVYEEAKAVRLLGKANPRKIREQVASYRRRGYPEHNGLVATALVVRRHAEWTQMFNERLWSLMCRYTPRDQLTFDYVLWEQRAHMSWTPIPGGAHPGGILGNNNYLERFGHKR
jgi:hypothetical protein